MNHSLWVLVNGIYHLPVVYSANSIVLTVDQEGRDHHSVEYLDQPFARSNNAYNGLNAKYKLVSLRSVEEIHPPRSTLSTSSIAFETLASGSFWKWQRK